VRTFYAAGYVANVPIMVVPVSPHQDVVEVVELLCVLAKHGVTPRSPRLYTNSFWNKLQVQGEKDGWKGAARMCAGFG